MIIEEKNIVEGYPEHLHEIKKLNDKTLYTMTFFYSIKSKDGIYQRDRAFKSIIIKNDISMYDLMDIINEADEDDIRQIIELLIYHLEKAHLLAKLKL